MFGEILESKQPGISMFRYYGNVKRNELPSFNPYLLESIKDAHLDLLLDGLDLGDFLSIRHGYNFGV